MSTIESMSKYKNDFTIKFAQVMQKNLSRWQATQTQLKSSLVSFNALSCYFGFAILIFVMTSIKSFGEDIVFSIYFPVCFAVGVFIFTVLMNIRSKNKEYQKFVKCDMYPKLLKLFGNISHDIKYGGISINDLVDSDLFYFIKFFYGDKKDDDIISGNYNNVDFIMNETNFGYKGKYAIISMFKGVVMRFQMHKIIKARVLILSKSPFRFVSIYKFFFRELPFKKHLKKNYERVSVEYEKFNKKYEIWVEKGCSGQIEARYLLNTAFLDRFMQIKTSFRSQNMMCSIIHDSMLICLETNKNLFEMNHLFRKIDDINQYKHLFNEFASVFSFIDVLNLSSKTKL